MQKSFLFGSVIAAIALFSGCGGSSEGIADTIAPNFTNATYSIDVNEGTDSSVALTTNETGVSFTEDSAEAAIDGSNLIFAAPNFSSSGDNNYTVNVIAKDEAGNASAAKAFTFNVKAVITESYEFNSSYVAPIGDKTFTSVYGNLKDPSGLLWDDTVPPRMSYADAKDYCEAKGTGWRMPTRAEFLNVIDYTITTGSLIDDDFSNYSADTNEVSWVENLTTDKYVVNHAGGTDSTIGNKTDHPVLCVYGDKNSTAHTFTQVGDVDGVGGDWQDDVTGLTWQTINTTSQSTYADAKEACTDGWNLPTINELRSIIDYNTNKIFDSIAVPLPDDSNDNTYYIWSSTLAKDSPLGYSMRYTILDGLDTKAGVKADANTTTHYHTCVKR